MVITNLRRRLKGALAASSVAICVVGFSSLARADYSYSFTLTPIFGNLGAASGAFTTTGKVTGLGYFPINSGNYSFNLNGKTFTGDLSGKSSIFFNAISFNGHALSQSNGFSTLGLNYSYTSTGFSGIVGAVESATIRGRTVSAAGTGFFQATLSAPSGGGPSMGVPIADMNPALGLLFAGATIAFVRRRRGVRHEATAA